MSAEFVSYNEIKSFFEDGWIDEVLFPVKTGKEATVYCCKACRERGELLGLFAPVPGDRARQRIEQEVLAVVSHLWRKIVVLQLCRKAGQHLGDVARHTILLCKAISAQIMPLAIDPHAS